MTGFVVLWKSLAAAWNDATLSHAAERVAMAIQTEASSEFTLTHSQWPTIWIAGHGKSSWLH